LVEYFISPARHSPNDPELIQSINHCLWQWFILIIQGDIAPAGNEPDEIPTFVRLDIAGSSSQCGVASPEIFSSTIRLEPDNCCR
jgi:hypothetical protein